GYVWVTSARARETTVTLLFPITEEAPVSVPEPHAETHATRGGRLLIVEDEDSVRRFLCEALGAAGFEVCEARNGREGLAELEARGDAIDLVLSDVVMPIMGGPEMAKELARSRPELPIVWMSGYTRDTAYEGGSLGKDVPFLQKPVSGRALVDAVRAALSSKRRPASEPKKHAER